jgi:hypothetical protein
MTLFKFISFLKILSKFSVLQLCTAIIYLRFPFIVFKISKLLDIVCYRIKEKNYRDKKNRRKYKRYGTTLNIFDMSNHKGKLLNIHCALSVSFAAFSNT